MTEDEVRAFNQMMMKIIKSDKKQYVPTGKDEFTTMIPIAEVLGHLRAFTNFIKSKEIKKT